MTLRQSIVGDAQSHKGCQEDTRGNAGGDSKDDAEPDARTEPVRHKNAGPLLGKENRFVESLLMGVSIGDIDLVSEVVRGVEAPRVAEPWATGDNVYVSGLDLSWQNFGVGDLLVVGGGEDGGGDFTAIINTGFPHFACWKYGVRAGTGPKEFVNR